MPKSAIVGGCLCGAVRFTTDRQPVAARACWCRVCQYLACGNASINVIVPTEGMNITGLTETFVNTAESGHTMHRRFCPACGTHLFSESSGRSDMMVVRVGALDDPEIGRATSIIWTSSAPSWACFDPDLPSVPAQPG